jgi:hypothetical protein
MKAIVTAMLLTMFATPASATGPTLPVAATLTGVAVSLSLLAIVIALTIYRRTR